MLFDDEDSIYIDEGDFDEGFEIYDENDMIDRFDENVENMYDNGDMDIDWDDN